MVDFSGTSDFYRIKQAAAFTADGRVIQKKILCCPADTLNLNTMITQKTLMIVMISK
jgi:hypothetical protein